MSKSLDRFFENYSENGKSAFKKDEQFFWVEENLHLKGEIYSVDRVASVSSSHLGSSLNWNQIKYFWLMIVLVFILLISRLLYLQVYKGDFYRLKAENNRQRILPIVSERGIIFDRQKRQLTKNVPSFSLNIFPQDLPRQPDKLEQVIDKISKLVDKDKKEIKEIIEKYKNYRLESIVIKENIDYETALKIKILASDLSGIYVQQGSKRLYLHDDWIEETSNNEEDLNINEIDANNKFLSLSHILGYVGKLSPEELDKYYIRGYLPSDSIGKTGVEKEYERDLRGRYGYKKIEVDALGKQQSVLAEEMPVDGHSIVLSIDKEMQNHLEYFIRQALQENEKARASGVVMNPNNGEILALVSWPSYDDNDFSGGIEKEKYQNYLNNSDQPLFNRAIGGGYPSGSTIKPAIASAALQEGIISAKTVFNSTGGLKVGQWFFPDWRVGGHGLTDVRKSLADSVNTFYYYIGGGYENFKGLGVYKINEYLSQFGFGQKTKIDLPAEFSGFIPNPEWKIETKGDMWYIGDTYNLSIGQGDLLVTPLQIANMTASIINGGKLFKPHVVKEIFNPKNNFDFKIKPEILNQDFISNYNLQIVKAGMGDCVRYGSCRLLKNLPFSSGGKTGTAQWSRIKDTHAWFTSFAPYERPEIVVTILVEEGGGGADVATPIAFDFYKWWWQYKHQCWQCNF